MRRLWIPGLFLLACACGRPDDAAVTGSAGPETESAPVPSVTRDSPSIADIAPSIEVTGYEIAYGDAAVRIHNGYFVLPSDVGEELPGILLIHDRWGLNDYVRAMARRLSGEGYAVLAIDLFDGQTTDSAGQADALAGQFLGDRAVVLENIRQARAWLEENGLPPRIAALGFGYGGQWALEAGLDAGDGIDAIVMFYGRVISSRDELETLRAPLLGVFAQQDDSIPLREVTQFRSQLRDLGKSAVVLIHPNVAHDFAYPGSAAYNHDAAVENWTNAVDFLDTSLRGAE
jgi:carboxymethylenebutenolidase